MVTGEKAGLLGAQWIKFTSNSLTPHLSSKMIHRTRTRWQLTQGVSALISEMRRPEIGAAFTLLV